MNNISEANKSIVGNQIIVDKYVDKADNLVSVVGVGEVVFHNGLPYEFVGVDGNSNAKIQKMLFNFITNKFSKSSDVISKPINQLCKYDDSNSHIGDMDSMIYFRHKGEIYKGTISSKWEHDKFDVDVNGVGMMNVSLDDIFLSQARISFIKHMFKKLASDIYVDINNIMDVNVIFASFNNLMKAMFNTHTLSLKLNEDTIYVNLTIEDCIIINLNYKVSLKQVNNSIHKLTIGDEIKE